MDEEKALRELFHILALLSLGQIDHGSLAKCEDTSGTQPGPMRMEVERLKEVIRRLLQGGGEEQETDPATGTRKGHGQTSLGALFRSLPTDIQNLLRRAFPSLDQLLLDEQQGKAGSQAEAAGSTPDLPKAQAGADATARFLASLLDVSNAAIAARSAKPRSAS